MLPLLVRVVTLVVALAAMPASAQTPPPTVVDPSGLALPGATVRLLEDDAVVAAAVTGADGTFTFDPKLPGTIIEIALSGFETIQIKRVTTGRITLPLARTAEVTQVVAPIGVPDSPSSAAVGNTLGADTVARMPSKQFKAKESLPLLPSVLRGADGLMHLGGATAHDTPVFLDGFNITDPSTGLSSLNLPFESVRGVQVLRDPMAVTYGNLMAGLITMESRPGADARRLGVQGIVPRPRFTSPGFGRLEGIFPRVYVDGPMNNGRTHYSTSFEYDYERIPVPGVTQGKGPDTVERGATFFSRLDHQVREHQTMTLEGFVFDSGSDSQGLSPRRDETATIDLRARDAMVGLTHRTALSSTNVVTVQASVLGHRTSVSPNGQGLTTLPPAGWTQNWFAQARRTAWRTGLSITWDRVLSVNSRVHEFSLRGDLAHDTMDGTIAENPVVVQDSTGAVVRRVTFGAPASFGASDTPTSVSARDVWHANDRLDLDFGARVDGSRYGGAIPSARGGARLVLDDTGLTVLRAGYGLFVGTLPLAVPAFGGYPGRVDQFWDGDTSGAPSKTTQLTPTVGSLTLPRARAATASLQHRFGTGLDAEVSFTDRRSSRLARLRVPLDNGPLIVESDGLRTYRELQISGRQGFANHQELFVSYVLSTSRGELNDFASLFQGLAAPLLQPGGITRQSDDARHRLIAWGSVNLPASIVVSPVVEWRSGFRYSVLDEQGLYVGTPNGSAFPTFFALDTVVYKTVTYKNRAADLGVQIFNLTNHKNPRDVYSIMGEPRFGTFTNSVGTILRGYLLVKW